MTILSSMFGGKRKRAAAHNDEGHRRACAGDLDGAIREYEKAISILPNYALAYNNLGMALWNKRKPKEAVAAFEKAVEVDLKDWMGHSNIGNALSEIGELDRAIAAYSEALRISPGNRDIEHNRQIAIREKRESER